MELATQGVQITVTVPPTKASATLLRRLAEAIDSTEPVGDRIVKGGPLTTDDGVEVPAPKRGRPKKTATTAPKPIGGEEDETPPEEPEEEETQEASDDDFDAEEKADEPEETITVEQVIAACKSHAERHGKEKTYKVLKRFGVEKPRDLEKKQYKLVFEALKG